MSYVDIPYAVENRIKICSQKPRLYFMSVRVRLTLLLNISLASWAMHFSGLVVFFLSLLPSPSQEQQGARQVCVLRGCAWAYSCGCSTSLQWPQQFPLQRALAASAVRNPQTSLVQSRFWGFCSQQKCFLHPVEVCWLWPEMQHVKHTQPRGSLLEEHRMLEARAWSVPWGTYRRACPCSVTMLLKCLLWEGKKNWTPPFFSYWQT